MKPVAVIPARLGSKRLPDKNLCLLDGKPLVQWAIEAALAMEADFFAGIWVSSESPEIGAIARGAGVWWHRRPEALAQDDVLVEQVLQAMPLPPCPIYVLLPSAPFRRAETMAAAWALFARWQPTRLVSLVPYEHPPTYALTLTPTGRVIPWDARAVQDGHAGPAWRHDGSHQIIRADALGTPWEDTLGLPVEWEEGVDINRPRDLQWAEWLCARRRRTLALG